MHSKCIRPGDMFVTQSGNAVLVIEQDVEDENPPLYWRVFLNGQMGLASAPWLTTDCRKVSS